jgi:hypothetical protein
MLIYQRVNECLFAGKIVEVNRGLSIAMFDYRRILSGMVSQNNHLFKSG